MKHPLILVILLLELLSAVHAAEPQADQPKLLPPAWDPKAAADKALSSMIQVTGPEVKGAHDADLAIVGDRAFVVALANDVKPGHGTGKDEYCTLSVVNLQRLQVERRIPLAKSAQAFANVTLPVGACFVPRILKLNENTLRCFFACEDQNGTGGRQAQMWYRDFDSASLTFQADIHRMQIKTAAGTFDMQPKYFHADAARQGFQKKSVGYGLYLIDSFKVFDGKTYAVINNFPGAQNALRVLNDSRDTVEVVGHYNEPADLRLTESAVNRLPDGTWLAGPPHQNLLARFVSLLQRSLQSKIGPFPKRRSVRKWPPNDGSHIFSGFRHQAIDRKTPLFFR